MTMNMEANPSIKSVHSLPYDETHGHIVVEAKYSNLRIDLDSVNQTLSHN